MKPVYTTPRSFLRKLFPALQKMRGIAAKFDDRVGRRFVINGGPVRFLDASLVFPEEAGLYYSTTLFWNGPEAYEQATSLTLAALIGRSQVFLDIGSNIGIYSVYAGVKCPDLTVFAFEPVPSIWEKNVAFHKANGLPPSRVLNAAVGDRDGVQQLILPVSTVGLEEEQTGTLQADSWQKDEAKVEKIDVKAVTIDAFSSSVSLPGGTVTLKIDVENFEAAVFRGARSFIGARQPWIVCEILPWQKFHPITRERSNNNEEVVGLIKDLGYDIFAITNDGYFRMSAEDFSRERNLKDFLLTPPQRIAESVNYFSIRELERWISNGVARAA